MEVIIDQEIEENYFFENKIELSFIEHGGCFLIRDGKYFDMLIEAEKTPALLNVSQEQKEEILFLIEKNNKK